MENQLMIFSFDPNDKKVKPAAHQISDSIECASKSLTQKNEEHKVVPRAESRQTANKAMQAWSIFVDGAARGNPGPAGAGIYISNLEQKIQESYFLGEKTNNQAEYLALVLALFLLKQKIDDTNLKNIFLTVNSDSELLVRQLCGFYKIKNPVLIKLHGLVKQLLSGVNHKFTHVVREQNKIADKLANEGIDKKKKIPTKFLNFLANLDDGNNIIEMLKK